MKYSLRSLMIVVTVLPPMLAAAWFLYPIYRDRQNWVDDSVIAGWCGVVFVGSLGWIVIKASKK